MDGMTDGLVDCSAFTPWFCNHIVCAFCDHIVCAFCTLSDEKVFSSQSGRAWVTQDDHTKVRQIMPVFSTEHDVHIFVGISEPRGKKKGHFYSLQE
jgi:hypothetical protein